MDTIFIFSLIVLILSIVIHEVAHGYVALMFGDTTAKHAGRLSLNPIKHIDIIGSIIVPLATYATGGVIFGWAKPVPVNPYNMPRRRLGELFTSLAGPASNLILALIFGLIIRLDTTYTFASPEFISFAAMVTIVNISLAIFNLMPIPPLDGSHILFALIPPRFMYIRRFIERYSLVFVILFIFVLWKAIDPIIPLLFSVITGLYV